MDELKNTMRKISREIIREELALHNGDVREYVFKTVQNRINKKIDERLSGVDFAQHIDNLIEARITKEMQVMSIWAMKQTIQKKAELLASDSFEVKIVPKS